MDIISTEWRGIIIQTLAVHNSWIGITTKRSEIKKTIEENQKFDRKSKIFQTVIDFLEIEESGLVKEIIDKFKLDLKSCGFTITDDEINDYRHKHQAK